MDREIKIVTWLAVITVVAVWTMIIYRIATGAYEEEPSTYDKLLTLVEDKPGISIAEAIQQVSPNNSEEGRAAVRKGFSKNKLVRCEPMIVNTNTGDIEQDVKALPPDKLPYLLYLSGEEPLEWALTNKCSS